MYHPARENFVTSSKHYYPVGICFAIPLAEDVMKGFGNILTLIDPFSVDLWWVLYGIFILASTTILALKFCRPKIRRYVIGGYVNRTPILNMLSTILGNSITMWYFPDRRALSSFAMSLFAIWSFSLLVVRSTYQGKLYDILQTDHVDTSLDTVRKVLESKVEIHTPSYIIASLRQFSSDSSRHRPENASFQTIFRRLRDGEITGVAYTHSVHVAFFNLNNYKKGILRTTTDRLVLLPNVLYFPKNSVLIKVMNEKLQSFVEGGFTSFWFRKYDDQRFKVKASKVVSNERRQIDLLHIMGSIVLGGVMLVFSGMVLILEVLSLNSRQLRRIIDFFVD